MQGNFITIHEDKFNEFLIEILPKHHANPSAVTGALQYQKFHKLDEFKKKFINQILENYHGIHFFGTCEDGYKLEVTDKKLCTFFMLKYAS